MLIFSFLVSIFFRYAKFCGVKTEAGTLDAFRDAASVSDYAREAMGWAVKAGLVKGDGQDLMPKATASRAQAAAILHRFAAVVEKKTWHFPQAYDIMGA